MQKKFTLYCFLFFTPLLLGYGTVEWLTRSIPSVYSINEKYLEKRADTIETLILGSSQVMNAVNAAWISNPTINLASGSQHHDTDFKLLKGMFPVLPSLKNVVIEVSYSHFEMPHNGKDFWKNSLNLHYYNINCFERNTYFKDHLLYLSHPSFFSKRIEEYYIDKKNIPNFNEYAFNFNDIYGQFAKKNYNKVEIDTIKRFKINTEPNPIIFQQNVSLFFEMLATVKAHQKNIIVCTTPMYTSYLKKRNPEILRRRDSIFEVIQKKYPDIKFLKLEEDTTNYQLKNYWNHSHLNPTGAKIFTKQLDSLLKNFK
ncbi:MAG: hypothetical protein R2781_12005 [Flavobacteriaceae bacterium]